LPLNGRVSALSGLLCNGLGLVESHLHFNLAPMCQITHDTASSTFTPRSSGWCQAKERFTQARKQRTATANILNLAVLALQGASNFSTLQHFFYSSRPAATRVSCYRKNRNKYRMHRTVLKTNVCEARKFAGLKVCNSSRHSILLFLRALHVNAFM